MLHHWSAVAGDEHVVGLGQAQACLPVDDSVIDVQGRAGGAYRFDAVGQILRDWLLTGALITPRHIGHGCRNRMMGEMILQGHRQRSGALESCVEAGGRGVGAGRIRLRLANGDSNHQPGIDGATGGGNDILAGFKVLGGLMDQAQRPVIAARCVVPGMFDQCLLRGSQFGWVGAEAGGSAHGG